MAKKNRKLPESVDLYDVCYSVGDDDFIFDVEAFMDNDGIGAYEFWGAQCFDRGHDFVGSFAVKNIRFDETGNPCPYGEALERIKTALEEDKGLLEKVEQEAVELLDGGDDEPPEKDPWDFQTDQEPDFDTDRSVGEDL
jgi:hypothetical protein